MHKNRKKDFLFSIQPPEGKKEVMAFRAPKKTLEELQQASKEAETKPGNFILQAVVHMIRKLRRFKGNE